MKLGRTAAITNACESVSYDQHEIERADELTPITCLDCGGNWRREIEKSNGCYYTEYCRYCIRGGMNEEGQRSWREDKKKQQLEHELKGYVHNHPKATEFQSGLRKKVQ